MATTNCSNLVGGVLSEHSVMGFSSHPPSPFGAHHLPQSVNDSRGGTKEFAMNTHTQLQLSLNPCMPRMATSFHPVPSPVTIHKPLSVSTERLALAVRLAKRDIQDMRIRQTTLDSNEPTERQPSTEEYTPVETTHYHDVTPNQPSHSQQASHCHDVTPSIPNNQSAGPNQQASHRHDVTPSIPNQSDLSVHKSPLPFSRDINMLRDKVQSQVTRLKELNKHKRPVKRTEVKGREGGRVWMEECEGREKREQRRRNEQEVRNTRMIYHLKQQVSSLQTELCGGNKKETFRKSKAVDRLAAAHRAALRTLTNYQGNGQIPPELALLLLQLNVMYSTLNGGENTELEQVLEQIKGFGEHRSPDQMPIRPVEARSKVKQMRKKTKKKRSQQNIVRGKPPKVHSAHTPLYRSTPAVSSNKHKKQLLKNDPLFASPLEVPFTPTTEAPPSRLTEVHVPPSHHTEAPPSPLTEVHVPPSHHTEAPPSPLTVAPPSPLTEVHVPPSHHTETPPSHLTAVPPSHHAEAPPSRLTMAPPSHLTEAPPSRLTEAPPSRLTVAPPSHLTEASLTTAVKIDCQYHSPFQVTTSNNVSPSADTLQMSPRTDLRKCEWTGLLERLNELESEADVIRERWHTVVYEDPLIAPAQVEVSTKHTESACVDHPLCPLTPEMLANISQYRDRYSHYLNLTGLSTRGDFHPWSLAESIADGLLSDLVCAVCAEVEGVCSSCIDTMYRGEFVRAPL